MLISTEDVRTFVLQYLAKRSTNGNLDGMKIDDSFDFMEVGIIDSLGVIEMIAAMEQHFKITVDFEQMDPEEFTILAPFSHYVVESAVDNAGSDRP